MKSRYDLASSFCTVLTPLFQIDGKNLTEIINETHENVKYLPGFKFPVSIMNSKRN